MWCFSLRCHGFLTNITLESTVWWNWCSPRHFHPICRESSFWTQISHLPPTSLNCGLSSTSSKVTAPVFYLCASLLYVCIPYSTNALTWLCNGILVFVVSNFNNWQLKFKENVSVFYQMEMPLKQHYLCACTLDTRVMIIPIILSNMCMCTRCEWSISLTAQASFCLLYYTPCLLFPDWLVFLKQKVKEL